MGKGSQIMFAVAALLFAAPRAQAGGPPSLKPCTVTFSNTGVEAITDEGKGPYVNGIAGTYCTVDTTNADLMFTLNNVKGAKASRSALVYLNNPVTGSVSRGLWVVSGQFHLHLADFANVPIGTTITHRVSFHIPYLGVNYKLRFGWDLGDGTSAAYVTRVNATTWTITPVDPFVSRLWTGAAYGDPTVYAQQGDYYAPFKMTVTTN